MNKRQIEALKAQLGSEKAVLAALEKQYRLALKDINDRIKLLQAGEETQSRIYQIQYQKTLRKQVQAIIDKLHADSYTTLEQFFNDTYQAGYVGTMYDVAGQIGAPIITPIDQDAMVRAVITDSKISAPLYDSLGIDASKLKKAIASEISRGIASGISYEDMARNIQNLSRAPLARAKTIARTEAHRIYETSSEDARQEAKAAGADVMKQWDATLDGDTRPTHRELDGQIRETDKPFEADGKKAMYPGDFGDPAEDCNCRCVALTRARWALGIPELNKRKEEAAFHGFDKSDGLKEFTQKYMKATETENSLLYAESERITKSKEFAVDPKVVQSRAYAEKFDRMASTPKERREYLRAAKEMLQHRSGQNGEDLYLYNRVTGKWFRSTTGSEAGTPEYTKTIIDAVSKAKHGQLVAFHNHPASMPPSDGDLNAAKQNGYAVGYALCHNGRIFEYTSPSRPIRSTAYDLIIANFKEKGYNEYDAQIETLKALSAEYGFSFKEVK